MLTLRSTNLLSAAFVALLASSSMTTFAEGDAKAENAMKVEEVAKPAEEKAEAAKPAPKKPMHSRIGAGEVGTPHNKLHDSWMKNSEQTSSQKAAEEARQKRLEEMHGAMKGRDPEKKELTVTSHNKSDADLKKSQEAAKARSASTEMPAWKKRALAAKKAREEKMAGHAAPHKAEVKKAEDAKPAEVKKPEPAKVVEEKTETTPPMPEKKAEPLPKMSSTEKKMIKQQEAEEKKAEPEKTTIVKSPHPAPKMSPAMKKDLEKAAEEKKVEPAKEEVKKAAEPASKDDTMSEAEKKEQARLDTEMKHAKERAAAKKPTNFLEELKAKRAKID
jgi:hypothetical protein